MPRKTKETAVAVVPESDLPARRRYRSEKPDRILAFLRDWASKHRYPPAIRDVVEGCGLSSTSVADYNLKILEREGHITRDRERARTISLVEPVQPAAPTVVPTPISHGAPLTMIPLLGRIAAGTRVLAPDGADAAHAEEHVGITDDMLGGGDPDRVFALTVRGDSMIDALIADADTVILESTPAVDNGQLAAVWLRDENLCTLKRFYDEGDQIRLQPEHPTMEPIITTPNNVEIQGRVLSVLRRAR